MPKRHGIYRSIPPGLPSGTRLTAEQVAVFRFGIVQVFEALRIAPFLPVSKQSQAAMLGQHFWEVSRRFLYSLQHLNGLMQQMSDNFAREILVPNSQQVHLEAGCQADHVLTY